MEALCSDKNENRMVIPGEPESSPFITMMMSPARKMGSIFANVAIRFGPIKSSIVPLNEKQILGEEQVFVEEQILGEPWSWKDIAYQWVKLGCPMEKNSDDSSKPMTSLYTHHSGVVNHHKYGPGGIH